MEIPQIKTAPRGFTLIELLVVVSIISILGAVVLTSTAATRDKGRIAAGVVFDDTNYHAFGSDALAHFDFNAGAGIPDIGSGYVWQLDDPDCTAGGTCNNAYSKDTPGNSGYSFNFAPGASPMVLTSSKPVDLSKYVISAWVKPVSPSETDVIEGYCLTAACPTVDGSRVFKIWLLYQDGTFLMHTGSNWNYVDAPTNIKVGKWSLVTLSYDGTTDNGGTDTFSIWVDGKVIQTFTGSNRLPQNGFVDTVYISRDWMFTPQMLDNISIYKGHL